MKKKVAIFGGAFDPPHLGHKKVVTYLMNNVHMDEVLIMPCGVHKLKGEINTDTKYRLEMTRLAFSNIDGVNISTEDIDISNSDEDVEGKGSTFNLLCGLEENYHKSGVDVELYFVIGQDNADSIDKWYNWEKLINDWRFIILPRNSKTEAVKWYRKSPHIYLKDFELINISSTELRTNIDNAFLEEDVYSFIIENGLYSNKGIE